MTDDEPLAPATRAAYAADWSFFTDWCTAAEGQQDLPAQAGTVIAFLAENPAPAATWKRRLAAIDHHHRRADLPPPSREPAVRSWLDTALGRPPSNDQPPDTSRFEYALSQIPTHGWPAGLAGRRDRLLLLLTHAGLTRRQLQQLRTTDLAVRRPATGPSILRIETGLTAIQLAGSTNVTVCAPCIWLTWQRVLSLRERYTGNRVLRDAFARTHALADSHFCIDTSERDAASDSWVFLAADQHGYSRINDL